MYTAAGHVLTINGANKTASVRMDGLDLAVLTKEDGRRRLKDKKDPKLSGLGLPPTFTASHMASLIETILGSSPS